METNQQKKKNKTIKKIIEIGIERRRTNWCIFLGVIIGLIISFFDGYYWNILIGAGIGAMFGTILNLVISYKLYDEEAVYIERKCKKYEAQCQSIQKEIYNLSLFYTGEWYTGSPRTLRKKERLDRKLSLIQVMIAICHLIKNQ